jgi:Arc/MetJ-type ribon-helix-helix transcriptional regulator
MVSPELEMGTVIDIKSPGHGHVMVRSRVTVTLPPGVAKALEAEVSRGRYASLEEAVLTGAKLVAGLGPRARELLSEGAGADEFVRARDDKDQGDWL